MPGGEADVRCRAAAAGGRAVHHVVVHQRAGVHELQRCDGAQHRGVVLGGVPVPRPAPAPVGERGPQALAAGGEGADLVDHGGEGRVHRREYAALAVEEIGERRGDRGAEAVEVGGREEVGRLLRAGSGALRSGGHQASIAQPRGGAPYALQT